MRASKTGTPVKVVILPLLVSLSQQAQVVHKLFSHINIDNFKRRERPK